MELSGLIHEELDLKIFILYVLRRMPAPIDQEDLFELCVIDNGVEYFNFMESLNDLIDSGHISSGEDGLLITEKGTRNADAVESSLPFSLRKSADRAIAPMAERLSRYSLINAEYNTCENGCIVHLALSDGDVQLVEMKLFCANENQAKLIKKNFRRKAESFYCNIISDLSENPGKKKPK